MPPGGCGMDTPVNLIAAFADEDRRLLELAASCPPAWRERRGPGGTLSLKETLGHLAFWDAFAVEFFQRKLVAGAEEEDDAGALDFEQRNQQEMHRLAALPYEKVLARYQAATAAITAFLNRRWPDLSEKERTDFLVPLRHRRHHRLLLERALAAVAAQEKRRQSGFA